MRPPAPRAQLNLHLNSQTAIALEQAARERKISPTRYVREAMLERLAREPKTPPDAHSGNED